MIERRPNPASQPLEVSDKNLQVRYDDWVKDINSMPSIYHEIGEKYDQPVILQRAVEDTKRYLDFLKTKEGIIFTAKQVGMQLSQPKTLAMWDQGNRIYNPIQLGANIAGTPIGLHVQRHGLVNVNQKYEDIASNEDLYGNRILRMYHELGHDPSVNVVLEQTKLGKILGKVKRTVDKVSAFVTGYDGKVIKELSGWGGPKSLLGLGWTDIRSYNTGVPITVGNVFSSDVPYMNLYLDEEFSDLAAVNDYFYNKQGIIPGNKTATQRKNVSNGKLIETQELARYKIALDVSNRTKTVQFKGC